MRDEPNAGLERRSVRPCGAQKGCWSIQTAGRWSWKSKPAKECEKKKVLLMLLTVGPIKKKKKKGGQLVTTFTNKKKKVVATPIKLRGHP